MYYQSEKKKTCENYYKHIRANSDELHFERRRSTIIC